MVGERIKQMRIRKGLTLEELGAKIGVEKATIWKYENGRVTDTKWNRLVKMAKVLDCSPEYLLGLSDVQVNKKANEEVIDNDGKEVKRMNIEKWKQALEEEQNYRDKMTHAVIAFLQKEEKGISFEKAEKILLDTVTELKRMSRRREV